MPPSPVHRIGIVPVRRGEGGNAVAIAAANAGERIRHVSSGALYDLSHLKHNVMHAAVVLPPGTPDTPEARRLRHRHVLWNPGPDSDSLKTSPDDQIARQYEALIPRELNPEQAARLGGWMAQDLAHRFGHPVDLTIQKPNDKQRDYVIRVLAPDREPSLKEASGIEQHWTLLTNHMLREAKAHRWYASRIEREQSQKRTPGVGAWIADGVKSLKRMIGGGSDEANDIETSRRKFAEAGRTPELPAVQGEPIQSHPEKPVRGPDSELSRGVRAVGKGVWGDYRHEGGTPQTAVQNVQSQSSGVEK